jgi:SAM-dependent methyltransferase
MDPYADIAPYYDWEHDDFLEDVTFFLHVIREGPVLEIGVGTGRVAHPIALAGYDVWGVDTSEAMLSRARIRLRDVGGVHLIHGEVDHLVDTPNFRVVLLPLNTLWHVSTLDGQLRMLEAIHARMAIGGLLLVDLSNPLTLADRRSHGELSQRFRRKLDGKSISSYSSAWDNESEQILMLSLTYEEVPAHGPVRRSFAELELRYLYRFELELLLRLAGFSLRDCYGSYDLQPYSSLSPNLIAVAESA